MIRPLLVCFVLCVVTATSKPTNKDRVHHEQKLSNLDHDDLKNFNFDHEAFLGQTQAKTFEELTPEESKRRLGIIVDKIDSDKNEFVTKEELELWITHIHKKQIYDDEEFQWKDIDKNKDGLIGWAEFKDFAYNDDKSDSHIESGMARDERRFKFADKNGDALLDKEEYAAFFHPEEFSHMKDIVVLEAIEDVDKDKDGLISIEEYIGDFYNPDGGEQEPQWLADERKQFTESRDKNKDGKLDKKEVLDWILPDENNAEMEAQHLLRQADADHDGKLTKDEILQSYEVFVGSEATNFGAALHHDEF